MIYVSGMDGDSFAEVALQYNDSYNDLILSFANNIHTADGGTHETGFKNALTKVINEYGKKFGLLKDETAGRRCPGGSDGDRFRQADGVRVRGSDQGSPG